MTDHTIPAEDGVYADIPEAAYHTDHDSLSSSGARTILWGTPAKFIEERTNPTTKANLDFGTVAHRLILGKGAEIAVLDPAVHGLTKDGKPADNPTSTAMWKQAAAAARDNGQTPIHIADYEKAKAMADRVLDHPKAAALLSAGDAEITGYWTDSTSDVRLRFRTDWLHPGRTRMIVVDYKTTKSAEPESFWRSCADYHYHQQDAWYRDGVIATGVDDDPLFLFIAQEKTPPYLVTVHEMPAELVARGRALNRKAIDLYAKCQANNHWPGYDDDIHTVRFPAWSNYREEDMLK